MNTTLPTRFSGDQLQQIIEEAMIYMCACPAQVAKQVQLLRELHAYQCSCISKGTVLTVVHERIADSAAAAHAELEACLQDVLVREGWDMATLAMPEGLRELRARVIENDLE